VTIELLVLLDIDWTSEKADKAFKEVEKTSKEAATRRRGNKKGETGKKKGLGGTPPPYRRCFLEERGKRVFFEREIKSDPANFLIPL
jgi:hypothetical protein